MCHIAVVHLIENLGRSALSGSRGVPLPGLGALDVLDIHDVAGRKVQLLLFQGAGARDIIYVHLITNIF